MEIVGNSLLSQTAVLREVRAPVCVGATAVVVSLTILVGPKPCPQYVVTVAPSGWVGRRRAPPCTARTAGSQTVMNDLVATT